MNENFKGAIEHILSTKFGGNMTRMATSLGFSPQQVSQWIGGKSKPSLESCVKIAEFLGVKFEELRDGEQFLKKPSTFESRLTVLEENVAMLMKSVHLATTVDNECDENLARVVSLMRAGSQEFRRVLRKTAESLKDSI